MGVKDNILIKVSCRKIDPAEKACSDWAEKVICSRQSRHQHVEKMPSSRAAGGRRHSPCRKCRWGQEKSLRKLNLYFLAVPPLSYQVYPWDQSWISRETERERERSRLKFNPSVDTHIFVAQASEFLMKVLNICSI